MDLERSYGMTMEFVASSILLGVMFSYELYMWLRSSRVVVYEKWTIYLDHNPHNNCGSLPGFFFHDGHHHRIWLCQIVSGATCAVTQVSLYSLLWLHLGSLESILGVVGSWMLIHPEYGTGMYEWLGQVSYFLPLLFHCRSTLIFRLKWASWMLFYVGSLLTLVRKGIGNEE